MEPDNLNWDLCENFPSKFIEQIDYSDKTPNIHMITKFDVLDTLKYYPLGNFYPNPYIKINNYTQSVQLIQLPTILSSLKNSKVKKSWFYTKLQDEQIKYSIIFLQVEPLKKFISKNYKSIQIINPFYYLFETFFPVDKNMDMVKKIILVLIENYDDHLDLIRKITCSKEKYYILELLYGFLPVDPDNLCLICLETEPINQLINICNCKIPSHSKCLIKMNSYDKLINCKVCKSKCKINEPYWHTFSGVIIKSQIDTRLFFPHNDLYYQPLSSSDTMIKVEQMDRLTFSIMYLQVDRVRDLLNEPEILENLPTYYFGYSGYKQTPLIALAQGNMPTNAHINFGNNKHKYIKIFTMLLNTNKINLNHIDAFDLKLSDYLIDSKIKEFEILLANKKSFDIIISLSNKTFKFYADLNLKIYSLCKYVDNSLIYSKGFDNKCFKRIYNILINIDKLAHGKIKTYQIFNELELEIICKFAKKNNILHQIVVKLNKYSNMHRYYRINDIFKKSYIKYIKQYSSSPKYFDFLGSDCDQIKIKKQFFFGVRIYKGFVDLQKRCFNPNNKFQIHLINYSFE